MIPSTQVCQTPRLIYMVSSSRVLSLAYLLLHENNLYPRAKVVVLVVVGDGEPKPVPIAT